MAELTVERYHFRLARRGWVRGAAAARVAEAAKRRLPAAVAERLAAVWPVDDGVVSEPLRLRLRVGLGELVSACDSDEALAALVARLVGGDALAALLPEATAPSRAEAASALPVGAESRAESASPVAGEVLRVLLAWRARGELAALLDGFSVAALEAWLRALVAPIEAPVVAAPATIEATTPAAAGARPSLAQVVRELAGVAPTERAAWLRRRIAASVEVAARLGVAPGAADVVAALDAALPAPAPVQHVTAPAVLDAVAPAPAGAPVASSPASVPVAPSPASAPVASPPPAPRVSSGAAQWRGDRVIECALPFLLLRPLARLGYLDALAAAFAAVQRSDELPAFATALAYKVLAPPERGWRRSPAAQACAAAFAGLVEPAPERALTALADGAAALLSPCDALVARSVLAGHDAALPLLCARAGDERVLFEVDGLFPAAWSADDDALLAALGACPSRLVIPADAAAPSFLAALERRGRHFVTDAPPTRGEHWRTLRRGRLRLWSNDALAPDEELARAAACFDAADEARALVDALVARPAAPLAGAGAVNHNLAAVNHNLASLERSLTLAAAAALGDLAWTLWREREPPTPRLALERFADLGARVRFAERAVEVQLPLGLRQRDLDRHRLLGELHVPWCPGRAIVLRGG